MTAMIVCVCNAIREDEIRAAARNGAPCAVTAYRSVDCEPQCGHCLPYADDLIAEERAALLAVDSQAA
jgi:bacterioferritin-associated ferredoxin